MLSIYRLPNKLPDEKVIKIVRRDLFILLKKIAFSFLLAVLPLAVFVAMAGIYPDLLAGQISRPAIMLSASAYFLFVWLFFFFSFIDYYLDAWIITSERIIDIEQNGFFSRVISEVRINKVQDVTSEIKGALPTVLNYGRIYIQTAGEKERFVFREVPDPDGLRDTIIKLAEICKIKNKEQ